jgi:hypothetical protein
MCHLPDLGFAIGAQRQQCSAEQVLLQSPQYITLVFGIVNGFAYYKTAIIMLSYFCIMSCGYKVAPKGIGSF